MLYRPHNKLHRSLSFNQELSHLSNPSINYSDFQKSHQGFEMIQDVLELIINKPSQVTEELLVIKKALSKWYNHIREQHLSQTRQIYTLKEKIVVSIKKEVGLTLQQIAYYIRSVLEEYQDHNLEAFYVKYLLALKKLDWGRDFTINGSRFINAETQTLLQDGHLQLSSSPHLRGKTSLSTIETPVRSYKEIDIHKYLQTKEENLYLQRQIDQLKSKLAKLEQQNHKLNQELSNVLRKNSFLAENQENYMKQMARLAELLEQHKYSQTAKQERHKQAQKNWQLTTIKCPKNDFKHTISKELDFAEEQVLKKEQQINQKKAEEYFHSKYEVKGKNCQNSQNPSRKVSSEFDEDNAYLMLLVQALAIEDFMKGNVEEE